MRKLSQNEVLSLNSLLRMEVNGLAVSKAVVRAVGDDKLREMTEAGISTTEARIQGMQQFLAENQIVSGGIQ
jgi:hypothetical protein